MNNWNIPQLLEEKIRNRDKKCVYCGKEFDDITYPTWEHIINDENIVTEENIALCCNACNSSKSNKKLSDWLQSKYCKNNHISADTVAAVIKNALTNGQ